jgi:hypothetical protein
MTTQAFTQTASFVLAGQRVSVTFEATPVDGGGRLTIDLKPRPADAMRYSFTGECAGGAGQCDDSIREAAEKAGASDVVRLCELWGELHLNDMSAGTRAQIAALADMPVSPSSRTYDAQLGYLAECGLMVDNNTGPEPYTYGSAWLYKPVDPSRVVEAREILSRLDGARIGAAADPADDFEEASFSNSDDVIDSRDVIARIEYLRDWIAAAGEGDDLDDAKAELAALEALESEAEGHASDWRYGETLIRDSYFEEYMDEMLEDIGDRCRRICRRMSQSRSIMTPLKWIIRPLSSAA